ncbi:MAG: methyltransferase domain-containing protein [Verrucomicrobiales bacterium]|nr:methyltransferase domain-containing protein [Verrucomicrobiales bacterium]
MSHQDTYLHNESYAEFLATQDDGFFAKYADAVQAGRQGGRLLDVGCGVGQVLRRWQENGFEAHGVEVSEPSVRRARESGLNCQPYDGRALPFPDGHFAGAGALNVLEHVEAPEAFIPELVRVVEPGGRVVISSPNFLRALGFRDYHHTMRGLANKWRNFRRLLAKRRQMRLAPDEVRFDRLTPVEKEPFEPDDDAIVATNGLEIAFFLKRAGCAVERVQCTDRYVPGLAEFGLNLTPVRYAVFNAFVVARKEP